MEVELRQYEGYECGEDGYPFAWHGECFQAVIEWELDGRGGHVKGDCCPEISIKDFIRQQADNRCERCWHPYTKGEGMWSKCDPSCRHGGNWRQVNADGWVAYEVNPVVREVIVHGTAGEYARELERSGAGARIEARYRILTVHHLDSDKGNCRWWNLVSLCQQCHLRMQRKVVMDRPYLYEHSEWFQPYAAAFYAFKYLDEDLPREDVMARLAELLQLEHRFTQGSLL